MKTCIFLFRRRVVIRLGSSMPFSQELNELQEEVKPLWKLRSCPRDFKRTSVERLFREARFALDWCSFRLVSFVYRLQIETVRMTHQKFTRWWLYFLCVLGRTGATKSAARKRETGTEYERWIGFTGFRNFRAHGVAMGQIDQSQHSHEKLLWRNCHHDLCVCYSVFRIGRFAQHAVVPGSRENVSIYASRFFSLFQYEFLSQYSQPRFFLFPDKIGEYETRYMWITVIKRMSIEIFVILYEARAREINSNV